MQEELQSNQSSHWADIIFLTKCLSGCGVGAFVGSTMTLLVCHGFDILAEFNLKHCNWYAPQNLSGLICGELFKTFLCDVRLNLVTVHVRIHQIHLNLYLGPSPVNYVLFFFSNFPLLLQVLWNVGHLWAVVIVVSFQKLHSVAVCVWWGCWGHFQQLLKVTLLFLLFDNRLMLLNVLVC